MRYGTIFSGVLLFCAVLGFGVGAQSVYIRDRGVIMSEVIALLEKQLNEKNLHFTKKPILIGGMAKEYYGLRKSLTLFPWIDCA